MALESACLPIPSEVTLPLTGFLAWRGKVNPFFAFLLALLGCAIGASASYAIGRYGGRPFVRRFGKFFLLTPKRMELAEKWFERWGPWTVFFCRLITGVRAVISIPAGLLRLPYPKFIAFTLAGYALWCGAGIWLGHALGENWTAIVDFVEGLNIWVAAALGLLTLALLAFLGYKKAKMILK